MLVAELITDDFSVLIYHRYRIWLRRVRVQLPTLSVLSVVFAAVASSLLVLEGVLWGYVSSVGLCFPTSFF